MKKRLGHITILVDDYENAVNFYVGKLGFAKIMDNPMGQNLRWISVAPDMENETKLVFVLADTPEKMSRLGSQVANHVLLVIETDDCLRDYNTLKEKGVGFFGEPKQMPWGIEVVFADPYGNRLDLLQITQ